VVCSIRRPSTQIGTAAVDLLAAAAEESDDDVHTDPGWGPRSAAHARGPRHQCDQSARQGGGTEMGACAGCTERALRAFTVVLVRRSVVLA
jgi:hypothetical protein